MEGIADLEAVEEEESFIPGGFFEEDDKIWKDVDAIYGGRTIKNELKYTNEEVRKGLIRINNQSMDMIMLQIVSISIT